jgi:hypothetical protein
MVLALAGSALHGVPTSAAAMVEDPVTAVQRQLVKGHGVRIIQNTSFDMGYGWEHFKPAKGVVGFGDGNVAATDVWEPQLGKAGVREICINGRIWSYDPKKKRPKGKKWVVKKGFCERRLATGYLRLDEPAVLAAVLATTTVTKAAGTYDGSPTTVQQGKISFRQLWEVMPELRGGAFEDEHGEWTIDWRLWVGKDGLVRRAWSKWRGPVGDEFRGISRDGSFGHVQDIRYSDWGMKVTVRPPSAAQTIDLDKVKT